ncbi:AraC family transcriptional regulator [Pedobacter sp. BS3]|uniref:AraC family transcriptional regulator n=1 Tax=Pedobacter sp. BS3 TaxID=2567937 RepID=UPI0016596CB2|nr:AraC family transcriptional regulator [Pedobacter sp. BS3]
MESLLKDSIYIKEIKTSILDHDRFHYHNAYEIALILKSKGTRIIGDSIENFTEGDLVLLGPNVPHIAYYNNDDSPVKNKKGYIIHAIVIYFNPNWLTQTQLDSNNLAKLKRLLDDAKRGIKITGNTRKKIIKNIVSLRKGIGLERIIIMLHILQLISSSNEYECLASQGYSNSFSQKDINRLDKVYQYIRDNFTEPIRLEDAAYIANMTPTAFCKFFKNKTQKTFSNFVNEIRIGYACKLLWNPDLTISQICYKCGFNNLTNFNKNFKRYTNMTPTVYKISLKH